MTTGKHSVVLALLGVLALGISSPASSQLKIGYINSNKVLETFKDAVDVRKQLQELNAQWEQEARDLQKQIQTLQEQLESQSLLLSEERKAAKQQEIQGLYQQYQQFLQEKWNPQGGEAVKKEAEFIQPVYDKINEAIKKIGEAGGYAYIFDTVAANILYADKDQPDLTEQLLTELNKGLPGEAKSSN